jgi:amino acid transporter
MLYADAVISPAGTGLVYTATSSRLSYALGREKALPKPVAKVSKKGVPIVSILIAFVVGEIAFLPFPSWQSLVGLVTSATAIMYAFAPISLTALRLRDPDRPRPYRLPAPQVLAPIAFVSANLIIYWSSFQAEWKLGLASIIGLAIFAGTRLGTPAVERSSLSWKASAWIWPWFVGLLVLGALGRYGGNNTIPDWWDIVLVAIWSLIVYFVAVQLAVTSAEVDAAVAAEEAELNAAPELNLAD